MSKITFTSAAVAVVNHERKSFRTEAQYDFLASALNLTPDTESGDLTDAARRVVLEGAANDGTVTGASLTADDLTGRDPGAGAKTRDYWKAARTVRAGLVKAVKRANPDTDDDDNEEDTTDYLAKIIAAVDNGVTHNLNAADIAKAVRDHCESLLS